MRPLTRGDSAELQGPQTLLTIRPGIFDFDSDLGLKLVHTKPKISSTVPTTWPTSIPDDCGPISACFVDDPKHLNDELTQPRGREGRHGPGWGGGNLKFRTANVWAALSGMQPGRLPMGLVRPNSDRPGNCMSPRPAANNQPKQ